MSTSGVAVAHSLSGAAMRSYLSKSLSHKMQKKTAGAPSVPLNKNKLYGVLAELAFRKEMARLGFGDRVSPGGWLARSTKYDVHEFGCRTIALFPETVKIGMACPAGGPSPVPRAFMSAAQHFHRIRIKPFYCRPVLNGPDPITDLTWMAEDLSPHSPTPIGPLQVAIDGFKKRTRAYQFLKYNTDASVIPSIGLEDEFSKEHLRISAQKLCLSQVSDIDAVFWGQSVAYPIEIKEKTAAQNDKLGEWFGLDMGPFTKMAFYAALDKSMDSLFVVHEIADTTSRAHVAWLATTFDRLAKVASWNKIEGGTNMQGGRSVVVPIPRAAFEPLDAAFLDSL